MSTVFGFDRIQDEVSAILHALDQGQPVDDTVERRWVDLKEERGRRDATGNILPGQTRNERAATALAVAAACMANTPGGGAIIVGVSNDGQVIGTALDTEWLRERVWQLSDRRLAVDIQEVTAGGGRLLVIRAPQAVEPIRVEGRIKWRVGTSCVEVDAATWHQRRFVALNFDWSAQESDVPVSAVRPAALVRARDLLRDSAEAHAAELLAESDTNLLRRLNVVTADGVLTNAGVLAFVGRGEPALDYIRRTHAGGDSIARIRRRERSLVEELADVLEAVDVNTPTVHLQRGPVIGQQREIPSRAAREAIVNGLAHREWGIAEPTVVEHIGNMLRVTSPGGFVGGVTPDNIITHPSSSRNRALAELLAALRVAEREGVGVDRMIADMVGVGHAPPSIEEIGGPYVRTVLIGDDLDVSWITWLREIQPDGAADDVNSLLLLRELRSRGWMDEHRAARLIQDTPGVAGGALARLAGMQLGGEPLVELVAGLPENLGPAWHLTSGATDRLKEWDRGFARHRRWPSRESVASSYASARGRISSTELGSLVGADPTNMGVVLKALEQEGLLAPAWPSRRGRGFYYQYVARQKGDSDGADQ